MKSSRDNLSQEQENIPSPLGVKDWMNGLLMGTASAIDSELRIKKEEKTSFSQSQVPFNKEGNPYKRLLLVCSSGGHFYQLFSLQNFWKDYPRSWVTFKKEDTLFRLKGESVHWAYAPTNRNIKNLIRNMLLAWKIISKEKPDTIVSTGAGVAVPFMYVGKLFGCKTIYIESLTRIKQISLTGKMVYPLVDDFMVQWPELSQKYSRAKFAGRVL